MKKENLFEAIGNIDDNFIEQAGLPQITPKKAPWVKWASIAASLAATVLIVGIIALAANKSSDKPPVTNNTATDNLLLAATPDNPTAVTAVTPTATPTAVPTAIPTATPTAEPDLSPSITAPPPPSYTVTEPPTTQLEQPTDTPSESETSRPSLDEPTDNTIIINSLTELDKMREMLSCTDEAKLNNYLKGIAGGGANSRTDLVNFINTVDSAPLLSVAEGDITFISHTMARSPSTEEKAECLMITSKMPNGNWTRIEYVLSVTDIQQELTKLSEDGSAVLLPEPITDGNDPITVYAEKRMPLPSEAGEIINLTVEIDGSFARLVCYSTEVGTFSIAELLESDLITD